MNLTLIKDTTIPIFPIISPLNNTYYNDRPTLIIVADDINLDDVWYSVEGTNVLLSGGPEYLDSSIWDSLNQGEFQINIFANDSAGNVNNSIILTLYKDTIAPLVTINLPLNNTHWKLSPIFNVVAYDQNPVTIWYQVVGYSSILLSNNTDEPLISPIWFDLSDGQFPLKPDTILYGFDVLQRFPRLQVQMYQVQHVISLLQIEYLIFSISLLSSQ